MSVDQLATQWPRPARRILPPPNVRCDTNAHAEVLRCNVARLGMVGSQTQVRECINAR